VRRAGVAAITAGVILAAFSGAEPSLGVASPDHGSSKAKWRLAFSDNFTNGLNQDNWGLYEGQPGGDPGGWWDPSHVVVKNGVANLETYRDPNFGNKWVSGGMSSAYALHQMYGKYLVRFRATVGYGVSNVLLLWPSVGPWPPEIDFAEDGGTSSTGRPSMTATLHYNADNEQIQSTVHADFTKWHTMGVEWTPGKLVYTLDGHTWATVVNPNVPSVPMEMDIQSQAGTCGDQYTPCPNETTPALVDLQVDSVQIYSYVPQ
jgi:beta-glucanase (GH16 family)